MSDERIRGLHDVIGKRPQEDLKMAAIVEAISTVLQPGGSDVGSSMILRQMMMAVLSDGQPESLGQALSAHVRVTLHVVEHLAAATGKTPQQAWESVATALRREVP